MQTNTKLSLYGIIWIYLVFGSALREISISGVYLNIVFRPQQFSIILDLVNNNLSVGNKNGNWRFIRRYRSLIFFLHINIFDCGFGCIKWPIFTYLFSFIYVIYMYVGYFFDTNHICSKMIFFKQNIIFHIIRYIRFFNIMLKWKTVSIISNKLSAFNRKTYTSTLNYIQISDFFSVFTGYALKPN